jgi:hypothetical protein
MALCGCKFCSADIVLRVCISQPCKKYLIPLRRISDLARGGVYPPTLRGVKASYNPGRRRLQWENAEDKAKKEAQNKMPEKRMKLLRRKRLRLLKKEDGYLEKMIEELQ